MGMFSSLHIKGTPEINIEFYSANKSGDFYSVLRVESGDGAVSIYTENVSDLEKLMFHLNSAIHEAHERGILGAAKVTA